MVFVYHHNIIGIQLVTLSMFTKYILNWIYCTKKENKREKIRKEIGFLVQNDIYVKANN